MKGKEIMAIGAFFGAIAVLIGAFGAHFVRDMLTDAQFASFKTASQYHFIHSLALLIIGHNFKRNEKKVLLKYAGVLMILGIFLFSFPLYLNAFIDSKALVIAMPIGGLCFVGGWITTGISAMK